MLPNQSEKTANADYQQVPLSAFELRGGRDSKQPPSAKRDSRQPSASINPRSRLSVLRNTGGCDAEVLCLRMANAVETSRPD